MRVAILTFDGFNEIDSFVALSMLGRVKRPDWSVAIASPTPRVTSMNGVVIERQISLEDARASEVVLVGSGKKTRDVVADPALMAELRFDPARQLIAAQCSGTLILAKLGLLADVPACTDNMTKPWVVEAGVRVAEQPLYAAGNVATAGGCLGSYYLATWILVRTLGRDVAADVLSYVTPVGEQRDWAARAFAVVDPYVG
jgi:transcriptional regulator GlxA family with amidase domain